MTDTIFCPRCKSENTTTQKAKQLDGSMKDSIIKVNIVGIDLKTGKTTPTEAYLDYASYMCGDCMALFAVSPVNMTKDVIT